MPQPKSKPRSKSNSTPKAIKKGQLDLSSVIDAGKSKDTGRTRAAKLLLALGSEQAAGILKQLEPKELELVVREMSRIDHIDNSEKEALLKEFQIMLSEEEGVLRGGIDTARKFLETSMGSAASEEILRRVNHRDLYLDFAFLETIDPQALAAVLRNEHSQVVAMALSYLKPKIAAEVLRQLPEKFQSEVARRIAKATRVQPDAIQSVARVLRDKFERRETETYSEVGGTQSLAHILNHLDRDNENMILHSIADGMPEMVEEVKEHLYTFEELQNLSIQEMRLLIANVGDDMLLATALRGIDIDLRRHFFNALSQNRATDVLDEIEHRGALPVKEVYEARTFIVNIARKLDEEGSICIKKEKEEYI